MRKFIAIGAVLALAACSDSDVDDTAPTEEEMAVEDGILEGDEPGFEAVAPGTYDIVHANGDVDKMTVHPGMTWSMVFADGEAAGGTIFMQGGDTCFVTEGVEGHECFTGGDIASDGSMESTTEDGETFTVVPTGSGEVAETAEI